MMTITTFIIASSITSTTPRIEEMKLLISMSTIGACSASHMNRVGSEGVAPEANSITPAAATNRASMFGAPASMAGLRSLSLGIRSFAPARLTKCVPEKARAGNEAPKSLHAGARASKAWAAKTRPNAWEGRAPDESRDTPRGGA